MHPLVRSAARRAENLVWNYVTQPWRRHRDFEERYVGRLLAALNVDCVLDVGANIGQYGLMLREYSGYRGLIVSFEPTPESADQLEKNAARNGPWEVRRVALGRVRGQATFQTMPGSSVGNSFFTLRQKDTPPIREITVPVETLSDLFPELLQRYGFSRPFLKMDTQGFDLEVFGGAAEILPAVVGLQSELSVDPFYEGAPDWRRSLAIYEEAGFVLSTFISNNLDWFPRLREMDCLMYRPGAYNPA